MLNISNNSIDHKIEKTEFNSFSLLKYHKPSRLFKRSILITIILGAIILFIPWTQNIRSKGYVTALKPEQRPQSINSLIDGRIEKWFVNEGNYVNKGDTILFISEIKDTYFDPQLLERQGSQINSKAQSLTAYKSKVRALDNQITALTKTKRLKIKQAKNYIAQAKLRIKSDSIDYQAAITNENIASKQLGRAEELFNKGLKSLTDLELKKLKLQETSAKLMSAENKLLETKNKLINAQVELYSIQNQYDDKIAKANSEKQSSLSMKFDSEAAIAKMQNQYTNYSVRQGMYYITASQNGYITQAVKFGLGETVKAGEELITIMPSKYDLAVAMYIEPMNIPLIQKGQEIRFMFDGWPTIVFSGWPNLSYGTFGGKVVAIDNFISPNGKYRILVSPDKEDKEWPSGLRLGSGANGLALLKDVPIWYELWRRLNGFPPDYYKSNHEKNETKTKK